MALTVRSMLTQKKIDAIYGIRPHQTVMEGLRIMAKHNIGALLVFKDEDLVGIFTERDYARKGIIKGCKAKSTPISEVMSPNVITVAPDDDIRDCFDKMANGRFRHLPVVENGQVIGLLSIGDLVEARIAEQKNHLLHLQSLISGGNNIAA